ncbi:MAG: DUF2189 domain-containing protein [Chromatiaceae bacterium]|nr:DUF2189 domain-containing protein [Chromatiaceae bacterium]
MADHTDSDSQNPPHNTHNLPFVAPCRELDIEAPKRWIRLGIADLRRAPGKSLAYGVTATILCYIAAYAGFVISGPLVLLTILSGLTLIGPVMAIGLYSISCQLQKGLSPKLSYCFRDGTRGIGVKTREIVYLLFKQPWAPLLPILQGLNGREMA